VIPPGYTPHGVRSADRRPPREPLVLFVGSVFNRRRLPDLITAFSRVAADSPAARLLIVGDNRTWPRQDLRAVAIDRGISSQVELRRYVDPEELDRLYSQASVFAFLSEYEGFGLTPLEALSAGVPILVLDTPVAREVYRDAAVYVEREDIRATSDALALLLSSEDARRRYLSRAAAVLARYSWDIAAARTLEHLERIAAR
jgi:glycosyltransferase involved in cell wall biosynthesis